MAQDVLKGLAQPLGCELHLARPLGCGLRLARPQGRGLRLARHRGRGLHLARPLGFVLRLVRSLRYGLCLSSTPWVRAPSRPTPRVRVPSRPMGTHTVANHYRSKLWAWVKTLTPGKRLVRLDVTRGHDGPYLRIHIKNSIGRAGVVLPNPRTDANRRVSSPRRPPGRSGTP